MLSVDNIKVYDLRESIIACKNAMRVSPPEYTDEEFEDALRVAKKLCKTPTGSGNQTFLSGIRVSFDLTYPNYVSPELQRYHWIDIVTSSSKMHRIMRMDFDKCCNKYVNQVTIDNMKNLVAEYNNNQSYENFMKVISNCPQGIELFMRISTNYLQLKTIYNQRKHHRLAEDWGEFCKFIENLPYAEDFITNVQDNKN